MGRKTMSERDAIAAYAEGFRERCRLRAEASALRTDRLRRAARRAAELLGMQFGVTRVWLFGSLAWSAAHPGSDVDLLVEGLPAAAWSDATGIAEEIVGTAVDLVRVEEAAQGLGERVRREGDLLYERG
jgi:predicted nucleotidyltransferase